MMLKKEDLFFRAAFRCFLLLRARLPPLKTAFVQWIPSYNMLGKGRVVVYHPHPLALLLGLPLLHQNEIIS